MMENADRVASVLAILDPLLRSGAGYDADARTKVVFHRSNFSHFLRHEDELIRPVTAEFWPSLTCNARCCLCPYRMNGARSEADATSDLRITTPAVAATLARELRSFGASSVLLTGGGEPFVNSEVDRIATTFHDAGLALGLYTNGSVPDRERQITSILRIGPRFVRMSINAGSEAEHQREYRIPMVDGEAAWEIVRKNAVWYLREIERLGVATKFGFSFILLGTEGADTYRGMAGFLRDVHARAGGLPFFAHFRPKFVYFQHQREEGAPQLSIPRRHLEGIARIPEMVEQHVLPIVGPCESVTVQVNHHAVKYVTSVDHPARCFSTGWATSFTHEGVGYIASELCGATWDWARWGDVRTSSMPDSWFGSSRVDLHHQFAAGQRLLPIHHKLAGVNELLGEIRVRVAAPFTEEEVSRFWRSFDSRGYVRPGSWDFI